MSLSQRINPPSLGKTNPKQTKTENGGLSFLRTDSPQSPDYIPPSGDTPLQLVRWMQACQMDMYHTRTELSDRILVRNVKLLLKKYTPREVKRAIYLCSWKSSYPYSTKYVRRMLEQLYPERDQKVEPTVLF